MTKTQKRLLHILMTLFFTFIFAKILGIEEITVTMIVIWVVLSAMFALFAYPDREDQDDGKINLEDLTNDI